MLLKYVLMSTHVRRTRLVTSCIHTKGPNTTDLWRGNCHTNGTIDSRPASDSKFFPQYSAMIFTDFLVQQIGKHAAKPKDNSTPIFIYAAYQSVHGPLEVSLASICPRNAELLSACVRVRAYVCVRMCAGG